MENKKNTCKVCGSKVKLKHYDDICSLKCLQYSLEYKAVNVPIPFVRRLFIHCRDKMSRLEQLAQYAKRHGYKVELVEKKATEIYKQNFVNSSKKVELKVC